MKAEVAVLMKPVMLNVLGCRLRTYKGQAETNAAGLQARSKDQEILEEGGGAGPSLLPRRDHE